MRSQGNARIRSRLVKARSPARGRVRPRGGQGFSGPAMQSYDELEYGGIVRILESLEKRFAIRRADQPAEVVTV